MGLLTKRFARSFVGTFSDANGWKNLLGGRTTAGVSVTEQSALRATAVYACVRILAETIASLPLLVYRRLQKGGKERAPDHPLYSLLHNHPNPEMTSFTWRETQTGHLALYGNAYSEIEYDTYWNVKALWPLRPDRTWPERDNKSGKIVYITILPDGRYVGLPTERVLHIPGLGFDGLKGYSPIDLARQAVGLSLAMEEHGARFFGNGAQPSGLLKHPQTLNENSARRIRESFEMLYSGLSNAHRIAVLEENMDYVQLTIPNDQAQFLESRKYQVTDIARIFRIPPHMIGDLERATFSNIEHQSIEFVIHTIRPWLVRWEQALMMKLLTPKERNEYVIEFLVDGLLRGDIESRYKAYSIARQNGWMSANEIRERENLNPVENGDIYLVPVNTIPADQAKDFWAKKGGEKSASNG